MELRVAEHPRLSLRALELTVPPIAGDAAGAVCAPLFAPGASSPLARTDATHAAIRAMLRHGGFKPSGRSKPASEYLARAAAEGRLGLIHPLVDVGNVVSLHGGIPISVIDLDRASPPLWVDVVRERSRYVFNAAGQELELEGLVCLHDSEGPCANAVKDAQRTKVHPDTRRALFVLWGATEVDSVVEGAVRWAGELFGRLGVTSHPVSATVLR